jgi:hypothetical protein
MMYPQVGVGDGRQIQRLMNVLNKQLQTANKGWSSRLWVEQWGLKTPQCKKKKACRASDMNGLFGMPGL